MIIERDETSGVTSTRYHYICVVEIAGRIVRARVERDFYLEQSSAVAEVLSDQMAWTGLTATAPGTWWHHTPTPALDIHAASVLGPLVQDLLCRVAAILAPPSTDALPPRVSGAISAYHGEEAAEVMVVAEFWSLMTGCATPTDLHTALRGLDDERLIAFEAHHDRERAHLYDWRVWAAATIIADGWCGDDGFGDFRSYLLSHGPDVCAQTLADPDTLTDRHLTDVTTWEAWSEPTMAIMAARAIVRDRTGRPHLPPDRHLHSDNVHHGDGVRCDMDPTGERWTPTDLPYLLPRLWVRYRARPVSHPPQTGDLTAAPAARQDPPTDPYPPTSHGDTS